MTRFKALLAGGAIAAMTAATAVAVSAAPSDGATAGNPAVQRPFHGQLHKVREEGRGWHHHGPRRGECGPRAGGFIEHRLDVIQGLMSFTPEQKTAFADLKSAIKSSQESMHKACEARKDEKRPTTAVERFNRIEASMTTRLAAMHTVKPALVKFYGSLDAKQKKAFDEMFARGPRG